ncbi:hypothetical protein CDG62_18360 [Acinetobacter sp. WCHA55]|nr:hypothetical protein CDG62_18360 [Acinetobacter sp. WCHA55]
MEITKVEGTESIGKSYTGFIKVFFLGVNCCDGRVLLCNIGEYHDKYQRCPVIFGFDRHANHRTYAKSKGKF